MTTPPARLTSRPLAVILARAGSKGAPGKNTANIGGRPCIAWTLAAARESTLLARTVVSTDGPHIRTVAQTLGAEVIDRPAELATDLATVDAAARHAVLQVEAWEGHAKPDPARPIVILYANVPLRPVGLIDRALRLMLDTGCDSVQSYAPVGKMHPWWMTRVDPHTGDVQPWEGGEGDVLNHGVFRRQDLPPCHVPDGGVLAVTRRALFMGVEGVPSGPHAFFGRDRRGIINPEGSVIDIDTPIDLLVADALMRAHAERVP